MGMLRKMAEVQQLELHVQITCYEQSQELEEKKCWFDQRSERWKKSCYGRYWSRQLYKTHKIITKIGCLDVLDKALGSKRGQATVLNLKSLKDEKNIPCVHPHFVKLKYHEIVALMQFAKDTCLVENPENQILYIELVDLHRCLNMLLGEISVKEIKGIMNCLRSKMFTVMNQV